jgi:uncharacterized membrane protein YfcA
MKQKTNDSDEVGLKFWNWKLAVFAGLWLVAVSQLTSPMELARRNWSFIFLGFFGAIIGNLTAVGGGIVFIPAMMFIYKLHPVQALKVALASQSFGMTSGAIGWIQRKKVPVAALKFCIPPMLIGSLISSLVIHPNGLLVKLLFGPVSILLGLLILLTIKKSKTGMNHLEKIPRHAIIPMMFASLIGGVVTGWIAIGEGEIVAALLMVGYSVSGEVAIGLGVVLLSVNSIFLMLIHQFFLDGIPWHIGLFTGLGTVFGARFAVYISGYLPSRTLKFIFAVIAIADGALFIFQYCFVN